MDLERFAFGGVTQQREGILRAVRNAYPAAHAGGIVHCHHPISQVQGGKLTKISTQAAAAASIIIHNGHIARGSQHGRAVLVGLDRSAAAGTAIANGIEAAQHGILKEGVVHMAALVLGLDNVQGFVRGDPARVPGLMFADKAGERLANHQAYIQRQAGSLASHPAGAVQGYDVIGVLQDDLTGAGIGDDLLQVGKMDVLIDQYQFSGGLQGQHFAVIGVGEGNAARAFGVLILRGLLLAKPQDQLFGNSGDGRAEAARQRVAAGTQADIKIRPAGIDITMQAVKERETWFVPGFLPEAFGGGLDQRHAMYYKAKGAVSGRKVLANWRVLL